MKQSSKVSLDDLFEKIKLGEVKDLNIIVKGDVRGSIEALSQSLNKLDTEEVRVNLIHGGVGGITESDIMLASASNAIVIGFNVRPNLNAIEVAKKEDVDVRTYRIIYEAIEDIQAAVKGMHAPKIVEEILGRAQVRATFRLPNGNTIAGIYVVSGKITRNANIRLLRDDVVIFDGSVSSLKRFKDDAKEVLTGFEAGLGLENFNDIKEGDNLEAYVLKEVKRD
jgi:translation initiation factor IF-2